MTIRVLIVDDHEPVRRGIRSLLTRRPDWSVCGEAADGFEAVEMARQLRPDVILMDMSMPRMSGAEAARIIRQQVPEAEVIIVSQYDPELIQRQVPDIGARGYVSKATLARDLLPAILRIIGQDPEGDSPAARVVSNESAGIFGGGDLGHLIRERDWSKTPLGPSQGWPQSLKTAVNLMLNAQHPMWIGWGPEMTFLYNDAYISVLSLAKHPGALGRPACDVWAEIWDTCGPLAERVFSKAEPSFVNDVRLFMSRGEYLEETYYSFSYSPIYDESGKVGGLFCPSTETTARVLHARRLRTLSEVSAKALTEKTEQAACVSCIQAMAENADDIPFALLYLFDPVRNEAQLQAASFVPKGLDPVSPLVISSNQEALPQLWPVREAIANRQPQLLSLPELGALPRGLAGQRVTDALVLPVMSPDREHPAAVLIAGINPTRKLDQEYSTFFSLLADQVAAAIQNATAVEEEKKRAQDLAEMERTKTITAQRESELRAQAELERSRLHDLLMQAPAVIAVLRGPEHQFEYVNRECLRMSGRKRIEDLVGKPVRQAMPELEAQGFVHLLDEVYTTGVPKPGIEVPVVLERADGAPEKVFFDFIFQPVRNIASEVEGILVHAVEVSEQVAARRAIERSEEHLRLAQAAANVGTWEWDPIDGSQKISPELQQMFGFEPNEPEPVEKWASCVFAVDWPKVERLMDEGHRSGEMDFEYRYDSPKSGLRWFHCKGRRLHNEARLFGVVLDVTDRKKAEEALFENEQRLRAMFEAIPEWVKLVKPDGTLLHMNASGIAMLETNAPETVVGRSVYDFIAPEDVNRFRAFNEKICQGERGSLAFDLIGLRGTRRHVEAHAVPLRQSDGSVVALSITHDVTDRTEVDRSNGLLAAIVDSSADAIISKNLDGFITSWNKGAERIFGYSADEAVGRHITLIIPKDRLGEETEILSRIRRGERIDHFETIRRRKNGEFLNASVTISPVKDGWGRVVGASKVARDITEQTRAKEALRESEAKLRDLSERLESEVRARTRQLEDRNLDVVQQSEQLRELSGRLLNTQDEERRHIARELHDSAGQTLAVLAMNLSSLIESARREAPELVQSAEEAEELVQQLTKDIRTTSYLLHPPLLEENGLPAALSWFIRGLTERSGLDITFNISEEFGRLPHEMELVVFRLIQECLANIHRHSGSATAAIHVIREPDRVLVEVKDQGHGMSAERLAEIQSAGAGLGIRGIRERLRHFNGEMIIHSSSAGTTVLATIPLSMPAAQPEPRGEAALDSLP